MRIKPAEIETLRAILAALSLLIAPMVGVGCSDDDTGNCCRVLPGRPEAEALIPQPEMNDRGDFIDVVRLDPAFDCSNLTCVSFQGSQAYCTRKCEFDSNCPEGFMCLAVIQSDPGPGSNIGPDDKFCVKAAHMCTE